MPIKKKKGGKGKKKSAKKSRSRGAGDSGPEDEAFEDHPATAMSGEGVPLKPATPEKKKKKVHRKMTKSEKATAKLDKSADKIRESSLAFDRFVNRMHSWFSTYYHSAVELFQKIDEDGDGILSYDEFKLGMCDLDAPCTTIELHLLAKLLDEKDTGFIDYTKFGKGLQYIRESEQIRKNAESRGTNLILTERKLEHCACCKLGLCQPYIEKNPKYLDVEMRLVTFDSFEDHPAHFTVTIHSHAPVRALVQKIFEETDIQSTTVAIFADASRKQDVKLPEDETLEELGYIGGYIDSPEEVTLFYDYIVEFTNCPLLLCDHYFGKKLP